MKTAKVKINVAEFRVWCPCCSIRIAPSEEQIVVDGKAYHQRCYDKTRPAQKRDHLLRK